MFFEKGHARSILIMFDIYFQMQAMVMLRLKSLNT